MSDTEVDDDCPTCGAGLKPSQIVPWHLPFDDCRAVREPNPRCKECGGQIQATVKLYLRMGPGGYWSTKPSMDDPDPRIYCENLHEVELSNPQLRDLDDYLGGLEVRLGAIEEPDDGRYQLDDGE